MHVKRWVSVALGLALPACDGGAAAGKGDASTAPPASDSVAPTDPALLRVAVEARNAASVLVKDCDLVTGNESAKLIESCSVWKKQDVVALRDATAALRAHPALPRTGRAAAFADELRLFSEWTDLVEETSTNKRGTLRHYQELALAWNAWQPTDKITVDIGNPEADGGPIVWQRCADGPCVLGYR